MVIREFTDEVGRPLRLAGTPARIISLVPSLTETLFDLGAGDRVVGVTDWCSPALPEGADPVRVGGVCNPRIERMLDLEPDLVLVGKEENSLDDVLRLEAEGIPVFATHPSDVADAARTVRNVGRLLGLEEVASKLASDIERDLESVRARNADEPTVATVLPIWKDPWRTVGPGSYPESVVTEAGAKLVGLENFASYPGLCLERAANARPGLVLLPDEPYDFHGPAGRELVCALARRCDVLPRAARVDGRMVAWYGSRSGRRLTELAGIVHPELRDP